MYVYVLTVHVTSNSFLCAFLWKLNASMFHMKKKYFCFELLVLFTKITHAKIHLLTNLLNLLLYFSFIIFSRVNETPILVITLRAQIFMEFLQLKPEKIQNFTEFNLCYMSIFSMLYFKTMRFFNKNRIFLDFAEFMPWKFVPLRYMATLKP